MESCDARSLEGALKEIVEGGGLLFSEIPSEIDTRIQNTLVYIVTHSCKKFKVHLV